MHILLVGNGNYKHQGERYYEPQRKLFNGLVRNGHNVSFFSDRDAARRSIFGSDLGRKFANQSFLEICKNFQPQLIIFCHSAIVTNYSIIEAQRILPDVRLAQMNVDAIFIPDNVIQLGIKAPLMHATFVTTGGGG